MMDDVISRQAAIDAVNKNRDAVFCNSVDYEGVLYDISNLPPSQPEVLACGEGELSAQPDLSEYSDKLWKKAYERGKAEALAQLEEAYISGETEAEARFHAQQRWIPCSERLPEEEEQVLIYAWNVHYVLAKYREIRTCDGVYKMAWVTEDAYSTPREIKHEVICWMPLPEPYREEGD